MLVLSGLGSATDREQADMSLFQRAHDIVAAKADKALDNAEKPDEMLDYSYNQMLIFLKGDFLDLMPCPMSPMACSQVAWEPNLIEPL